MIFEFTSKGKDLEQSGQDVQGDADLKTGLVALLSNSCFTTRLSLFLGVFFFSDFSASFSFDADGPGLCWVRRPSFLAKNSFKLAG